MQHVQTEELWQFSLEARAADKVYLVKESHDGLSTWIEMRRTGHSRWTTLHHLNRGQYRFRYYTAEGNTVINCGAHGLSAKRVAGENGDVRGESLIADI